MAVMSGSVVALLVLLAIFAPMIWGSVAAEPDPSAIFQPPSAAHPLGTDGLGRDLLLRTLVATRTSLVMALIATACGAVAGLILGALPAVLGARAQRAFSAVINTWLAFPVLLVAMLTVILLGAGPTTSVIALALTMTPSFARLAQTLSSRVGGSEYLAAAKMLGVSKTRQYLRYVLPNIAEPVIVNVTISIGGGLLALSSLSFLGVGIQPPEYDWGRMLNEGFAQVYSQPTAVLGPGLLVVLAGLSFGMFGEALAAHMRQQGRGRMLSVRKLGPAPSAAADRRKESGSLGVVADAENPDSRHGSQTPLLEVEGLSVSFPGEDGWVRPVRDVSFSIMPGELVGVVGESGSGKSITMMSVAQLAPANAAVTATRLRFNGVELSELSPEDAGKVLGTQVGVIFQDSLTALNPALRVGTQLAEVPRVHEKASRPEAHRRAVAALDEVRIPDPERRAQQFPHEFSGGMRQRSLIAMAQIGHPSLLIADEPTTALDVTVQQRVLALLRAKCEETGAAAVVISHDIAVLAELCSRILVMYRGEIVENVDVRDLPHPERLQHPYSRALVECMPDLTTDRSLPLATIPEDPAFSTERADDAHPSWERKPTQLINVVDARDAGRASSDLVVENLEVTFGHGAKAFNAVDGVSFELASGSVLGLVGESGSGKSTVARTIAGLQPASAGRVTLGGVDLLDTRGVDRLERARDVQMIFQDPYSSLNPRMSVREVLDEVLLTHGMSDGAARRSQVAELLDLVRLRANTAELYPGQMSGGMRQRVAIARCLATRPRLIIADEITSALDASVQGAVLNLIRELQRELDISMLFITHNLAAVRYIADRTAVMQRGRIVEIADPDRLVQQPEHPYTRTLVDAIPRIENAGTDALLRSLNQ